jgi:hypothetical protein
MQMINISTRSRRKKRKPTAKQRELQADWEALLKKYPTKNLSSKNPSKEHSSRRIGYREILQIPSLPFTGAPCPKAPDKVYTGTMIVGIATMHKSNAVPVFSNEAAVEISKMRRG